MAPFIWPERRRIRGGTASAHNPGTAQLWAEVELGGKTFETNRVTVTVSVTLDMLQAELDTLIQSGEVAGSMSSQLTNSLKQTRPFLERGEPGKAKHHLEKFIGQLNNRALSDRITENASNVLGADASALAAGL